MDTDSDSDKEGGGGGVVAPVAGEGAVVPVAGAAAAGGEGTSAEEEKKEPEIFAWRIPLTRWRAEGKDREHSPEFLLDDVKWRLLVFPKGNPNHNAASIPGTLAAYLEVRDSRAWFSTNVHFKVAVAHPTDPTLTKYRDSVHAFTPQDPDRGFNDLLTAANQHEYIQDDGSIVINVIAVKAPVGYASRYDTGYVPYDSKSSTGFCGLLNQGATCYMNSMLQALFLLPKFREVVYQIPSDAEDRGAKIGFALQRVFHALQVGQKGVSTKQLTASFGWGSIDSFMQHDVQEFWSVKHTKDCVSNATQWPPAVCL
jgi:ubiquitin carboxyl-terminal hydrolase 7